MACRLFDGKPLSKPMLEYCLLDPWEQTSGKGNLDQNLYIFIQENAFENVAVDYGPMWEVGISAIF